MSKENIRKISESGFQVTVPVQDSFRFCECAAYKALKGLNLQEMDVGWWDSNEKIILLELKGHEIWDNFDKSKDTAHNHLVASLTGKATDALLMLAAAWVGTKDGADIKTSLPMQVHTYPGEGKIRLIFLIDTPPSRMPLLGALKDEVKKRLEGRLQLFGSTVILVDFVKAQKMQLPVVRN